MQEEKSDKRTYPLNADDPYKVLAFSLVVNYTPASVRRLMTDTEFLREEIQREVRKQDFRGYFLDCLFVSICEDRNRMSLMRQLDDLGKFFYMNLDKDRMRAEIRKAYNKLGLGDILEEGEK